MLLALKRTIFHLFRPFATSTAVVCIPLCCIKNISEPSKFNLDRLFCYLKEKNKKKEKKNSPYCYDWPDYEDKSMPLLIALDIFMHRKFTS